MQRAAGLAPAVESGPLATEQTRKRDAVAGAAYTVPVQAGTEDKQLVADKQAEGCERGEAAAVEPAATRRMC